MEGRKERGKEGRKEGNLKSQKFQSGDKDLVKNMFPGKKQKRS